MAGPYTGRGGGGPGSHGNHNLPTRIQAVIGEQVSVWRTSGAFGPLGVQETQGKSRGASEVVPLETSSDREAPAQLVDVDLLEPKARTTNMKGPRPPRKTSALDVPLASAPSRRVATK